MSRQPGWRGALGLGRPRGVRSGQPAPEAPNPTAAGAVTLQGSSAGKLCGQGGPGQGLGASAGAVGVPVIDRGLDRHAGSSRLKDGRGAGLGGGGRLP